MPNPYLQQQQDAITNQVTNNLQRRVLPGISRGAMAAGGYGGSRQGIAEGLGIGESSRAIADATGNMQGQAYAQDQQIASQQSMQQAQLAAQERMASQSDATQRYGLGNQYSLGLGNLGLGYQTAGQNYALGNRNADTNQFQARTTRDLGFGQLGNQQQANNQNFYTQQRGQDMTQQGMGFDQWQRALQTQLGLGQSQVGIGQQQQAAPWQAAGNYGNILGQFSGLNQSQTNQTPGSGGGWAGAAGGALTAAQLYQLYNRGGG